MWSSPNITANFNQAHDVHNFVDYFQLVTTKDEFMHKLLPVTDDYLALWRYKAYNIMRYFNCQAVQSFLNCHWYVFIRITVPEQTLPPYRPNDTVESLRTPWSLVFGKNDYSQTATGGWKFDWRIHEGHETWLKKSRRNSLLWVPKVWITLQVSSLELCSVETDNGTYKQ